MRTTHRVTGDSVEAFMDSIAAALAFPDYFGRNLDALYDCLADLTGEHVVVWVSPSALRKADPDGYTAVASVLADAVADGTGLSVLFRGD
ncbi:barstar family protein [Nonomuraea sp. NPDC050556]|uniref:barstar family protein n=1 Tax=Nonomuraea sp. NPDC050556 TaxID=3364369 RepID=UPI0037A6E996